MNHHDPQQLLVDALRDLLILDGSIVGPSGVSWQDVAGTAACNLRVLASWLDAARRGEVPGPVVMPAVEEAVDTALLPVQVSS